MLEFIRGMVRPTLTWVGFIALTAVVAYRAFILELDIPDWYQIMVGMMVAYWFGQRTHPNGNGG